MTKNEMKNLGFPLSVDVKRDMPAIGKGVFDSWYVISNFEADGQKFAFEWHQQIVKLGVLGRIVAAEFVITNATKDICKHNALSVREGAKAGASCDKLHVWSAWGGLDGDEKQMRLKVQCQTEGMDVVLTPTEQVLYNGTTGLIHFGSNDSYQFSFPIMKIEGTFTFEGKTYEIKNTTAWFDRQWGYHLSSKESVVKLGNKFQPSWLWLGMSLNEENTEVVSLWDAYVINGHFGFATFLHEDGSQNNAVAEVTYEELYTSKRSGNRYPRIIHIKVPQEELELKLVSLVSDPEFYHEQMKSAGCQVLCRITGTYKGQPIEKDNVVELVNNVCGDAYKTEQAR